MAEVEAATGWRSVQELAESGRDPPDCYILRLEDRTAAAAVVLPPETPIPVVDIRRVLSHPDEAARLRSALQSWGLFQAIGHDIPASFLDEVHNVAKEFFRLPMEVKQKYSNLKGGKDFPQGYGTDHATTAEKTRSWTDSLSLVVQPEDEKMLHLWPEEPSSFRDILHEFIAKLKKVKELVLMGIAKLLELNEDYFINQFGDKARVATRFGYYPSCSRPDLVVGLDPHSDNSVITILLPDKDVEGLQVLKDDHWVKVPAIPHALLVTLGDLMEIMSNGIFKSPVHRVMTNSEKERLSVVVFYHPDLDKDLISADSLVNETRPRLYKTMKTGTYLEVFFQSFQKGKRAIEWAKI